MSNQFVFIEGETYPVNTSEEIEFVAQLLKEEGLPEASVWVGDEDSPDSFKNGQKVFSA